MGNPYFKFKQFNIFQDKTAMKVGVDSVLLGAWAQPLSGKRILDIGTGTGLLALMIAQKSDAAIIAIEIDKDSAIQASQNVKNSPWPGQVDVINLSFQEYIDTKPGKFDHVICNPPFFNSTLPAPDQRRAQARHDQSLSLEILFEGVYDILKDDGYFDIIYQYIRKKEVLDTAASYRLFPCRVLDIRGNEKKAHNRTIIRFSRARAEIEYGELAIRYYATNQYTKEYIGLVKDYYLNV
jgi:tRNA1Val (adenine37-N6)-methyltransferase